MFVDILFTWILFCKECFKNSRNCTYF